MKITQDNGQEIEVYTADEVTAKVAEATKAKEGEYTPKLKATEEELARVNSLLGERSGEFKQFRELHADVVAKLTATERTLYENQLAQKKADDERTTREVASREALVLTTIKGKVGIDEKVITKVKDMYNLIGIEANTPEEIEKKVMATIGAVKTTEPDLLSSVAGFSGGYTPPVIGKEEKSFADTEKGKQGLAELGLNIPEPKK